MAALTLSKRLQTVVSMIPRGKILADIGTDHARLPCYAYLNGLAPYAVAGEVADGPYRAAIKQVEQLGMADVISVRKGDGLEVIAPGEVDVIVIAGMGGSSIASILDDGKPKLAGASSLILQPNTAEEHVRRWLMKHDWALTREAILEENGRFYEVLAARPGDGCAPYRRSGEAGLWAGPFLLKEKNAAFRKKWQSEIEKWKRIEAQLNRASQTEEIDARRRSIRKKRMETEEILNG